MLDKRKTLLGIACLCILVAGIAWRWETVLHGGDYRYSLGSLGYSDVVQLYVLRNFAAHQIPYLQQPFEYPVLTGFTIWLTTFAPGIDGYFLLNAFLLGGAGIVTYYLLARFLNPGALARYALAPGLALYVMLNWDMLSLLALSGGLLAATRRRFIWCGLSIGIGASYKLYPAFALPVLLAWSLALWDGKQRRRPHPAFSLLGSFLVTVAVCNLPVAILSPSGWSYFWTFQSGRPVDPDAIWAHLPAVPDVAITRTFVFIFMIGVCWLALRVYLNRGTGWQAAILASLLLFLIPTRDYSPQYDVWLLPLLALLCCPWELWIVFVLADLAYYVTIFFFLYPGFGWPAILRQPAQFLDAAVWMRETALLLLLAWAVYSVLLVGGRDEPRSGIRFWMPLSAGVAALFATLFGAVVGLVELGVTIRGLVLVGEAGLLTAGVVVAAYRLLYHHWRDAPVYISGSLVPLVAVILVDFSGLGSYLIPGLLLCAVSAIESWYGPARAGGPPREEEIPAARDRHAVT